MRIHPLWSGAADHQHLSLVDIESSCQIAFSFRKSNIYLLLSSYLTIHTMQSLDPAVPAPLVYHEISGPYRRRTGAMIWSAI